FMESQAIFRPFFVTSSLGYIKTNAQYSDDRKKGEAKDYMTGAQLDQHQSHDLDHIKSAKEIHDDAGRVLAEIKGTELANTETNLKPTTAKNNRSKKADPMEVFLAKKNEKLKKIKELESKDNLPPQEKKELENIKTLAKIDDEKARGADKKAREEIDKKINGDYYGSKKFIGNTAITGLNEGSKMGMQQAIGLVMTEFFTALFDEILDIYKNGFSAGFDNEKFLTILKKRLQTIARKIKAKWKDVAIAFKDGFISGFISNLVTTVTNMFVTTAKRVIRIIREGIYSLFKAIKLLIFPPENMTYEEAMHEAKKIIASGLIVTLGVIAEEYIEKFLASTGALASFSSTLTAIFVGAITGLAIIMTVYYLDKRKNDKDAIKALMTRAENSIANGEALLAKLNLGYV
ncbi:lactate permease, partial [Sulfurospirillum sp. UBA4051]|uniref:lactate permease n=1 Tax=Sulfurospirillum sp. UBA4051 TaxID=1947595 RepID=UPI0025FF3B6E